MSDKRYKKSSKKPVIIVVVLLIILAAAVAVYMLFFNEDKPNSNNPTMPTTIEAVTDNINQQATEQETFDIQQTTENVQQTTKVQQNSQNAESSKIVVPTEAGSDSKYFSGEFTPYKAVDTDTNSECPLKEVFGSSYSGGTITFNDDGSFSDTLSISSVDSGAYILNNSTITATYSNDKNVTVEVIEWSDDVPSGFIINYGGYDVYFN